MTDRPSTLPLDFELAASVESLAVARRRLGTWLSEQGIDGVTNSDLLSVATEFFLHVVVKAGGVGHARLVAVRASTGVRLSVTAAKSGDAVRRIDLPTDPLEVGSIGRRLVDGCCDEVELSEGEGAVRAQCWRAVRSA